MDSLETNETTALEQSSEITNEQVTEPVAESATEQPVAEQPAAEEPKAEVPVAEQPVAEEPKVEQPEAEEPEEMTEAEQQIVQQTFQTKEEVVARVREIAESDEPGDKTELNLLKQLFYKFHNAEVQEAFRAFVEAGGEEDKFMPEVDAAEPAFRAATAGGVEGNQGCSG